MKKVIYIVSDIEKALAFEWLSAALQQKFELIFILIGKNETSLMVFLKTHGIRSYYVDGTSQLIQKWLSVFKILWTEKPTIVHTHMWTANLIGLSTAWLLNVKKRIFTRHHAMIHHNEYTSGLKWDKLCNLLATDIIAVSENIKNILVKYDGANETKVHIIHHGFDLQYFVDSKDGQVAALRKKYNIKATNFPVIGIIARYTKWKGIQYIIEAFKRLKTTFPNAHIILANAGGDYEDTLHSMLPELPEGCYTEIVFEENLNALYKLFDVYVHVPTDELAEAFGQTYIEALASGVPSVFTLSGVAKEFIVHSKNALVVDFENPEQIYDSIKMLLENDSLRGKLIKEGHLSVEKFSFDKMLTKLEALYV